MTTVASWTVLDSKVAFADPWLRVRSDQVRTADGDVFGPYHVIEAPDWVTIVPLTRDGQRLLTVREYRHGIGAVLAGLPGGLVDPGDGNDRAMAAEAAARRELWEETSYSGGRIERLAAIHPNPSNQTNTAHCFLASGLARRALPQPGGAARRRRSLRQTWSACWRAYATAAPPCTPFTSLRCGRRQRASHPIRPTGSAPCRRGCAGSWWAARDVPAPRPTPTTPEEPLADRPPAPGSTGPCAYPGRGLWRPQRRVQPWRPGRRCCA